MPGKFHAKNLKKQAEQDYEKAWLESAGLLKEEGKNISYAEKTGKAHPVADLIFRFREILLSLGFDEKINPSIVEDKEVYRQYGPEAPLILDRVFYLAGLPRQDIGIDSERQKEISAIVPGFEKHEELRAVLRDFKGGNIEGDDLIESLTVRLGLSESQATRLVSEVFEEFSRLEPQVSHLTLRSHMTANWFGILSKMQTKKMPVKLFSIGSRYRREQRQDPEHLYESTSASVVAMNPEVSMEDGEILTQEIISRLGLSGVRTVRKETTSKYYAPGFDWEVYAKFKSREFEIANLGLYSPVSLAKYRIMYPVMNLGFGVERIAMILTGSDDIRELVYG